MPDVLARLADRRLLVMGGDGTLHVATRELHREGRLATTDVVVLLAAPRWDRLALARSVMRGDHVDRDDVRRATGRRIELRGEVPGHNADGELSEDTGDSTWHVEPSAWRLCC